MLPKEHRLKNKDDFQRAYKKGRFFSLGPLTVNYCRNETGTSRFGFVVGKNYSKSSVERNRARRVLRSSILKILSSVISNNDFIIGIRGGATKKDIRLDIVIGQLEEAFKKNKFIK